MKHMRRFGVTRWILWPGGVTSLLLGWLIYSVFLSSSPFWLERRCWSASDYTAVAADGTPMNQPRTEVAAESTAKMPDSMHAKTVFAPIIPSNLSAWRPIKVEHNTINISGGRNKAPHSAASVDYTMGTTKPNGSIEQRNYSFIELNKNAQWFLKSIGGSNARKGDLKNVEVIQLLRAKFCANVYGYELTPVATAVADGEETESQGVSDSPDAVSRDPMDALDCIDDGSMLSSVDCFPSSANRGRGRGGKGKGRGRGARVTPRPLVHKLTVPTRPRCAGGNETETIDVWVYKVNNDKKINLSLRSDFISWLLAYASDEYTCQGVEALSPVPASVRQANCTAVADLHVAWQFDSKAWEGTFLAGPHTGVTKRISVTDISEDMWKRLGLTQLTLEGFHCRGNWSKKKAAAKEWMVRWCADIAQNKAAVSEFAMDEITTPMQRDKRRRLNDTAVAADEDDDVDPADAVATDEDDATDADDPADADFSFDD